MKLQRRKWLFGGVVMFSLQLSLVIAASAQSADQVKNRRGGEQEVCHLSGNGSTPYEIMMVERGAKSSHLGHGDVEPQNGVCPSALSMASSDRSARNGKGQRQKLAGGTGAASFLDSSQTQSVDKGLETKPVDQEKVAVCHREGNGNYHLITVSEKAMAAHLGHGDMYPEAGGCLGGGAGGGGDAEPGATPEPVTIILFGAGLAGIGYATRRRLGQNRDKSEA